MPQQRNNPSATFWCAVVLLIALAYPLSLGPACLLMESHLLPSHVTVNFYRPVIRNAQRSKWPMRQYLRLWGIDDEGTRMLNVALDLFDQIDAMPNPVNPPTPPAARPPDSN